MVAAPSMTRARLQQVLEAILFVGCDPVSADRFTTAFPEVSRADFEFAIDDLANRYRRERRPYQITSAAGGFVLGLKPRWQSDLQTRSRSDRSVKLSRQALETLSVIAYRQPISRKQTERLLGFEIGSVLGQLLRRKFITNGPQPDEKGKPRFVTTQRFLEQFGLESLEDLPATEDLQKL